MIYVLYLLRFDILNYIKFTTYTCKGLYQMKQMTKLNDTVRMMRTLMINKNEFSMQFDSTPVLAAFPWNPSIAPIRVRISCLYLSKEIQQKCLPCYLGRRKLCYMSNRSSICIFGMDYFQWRWNWIFNTWLLHELKLSERKSWRLHLNW